MPLVFLPLTLNFLRNILSSGSSVDENGTLNGFNSPDDAAVLITFMISKNSSNIKKNVAVPAASAGPKLDKTLLTIVLNTCAAYLTFITECGVKQTCLYVILGTSCNPHSWSSRKCHLYGSILKREYHSTQSEYPFQTQSYSKNYVQF